MESRAYWRDRALLDYGKHEAAFADQSSLLEQAMEAFQTGSYPSSSHRGETGYPSAGGTVFPVLVAGR